MLSFNPAYIIVVFLLVCILVIVLSKIFFRPVRKVMGERESRVRNDEEACQKALTEAEKNLQRIEESIRSATSRAASLRQEMESQALKEKSRLIAEVGQEYRSQVEEAKKKLDEQYQVLKGELASRAEGLSEKIEKRLLQ